ncbi:cytidylyltransferase domain-containing protein [Pseudomonadota bacterium]
MKRKSGKVVATIECRMTSSRLPGKILMDAIDGKSMLELMIERVARSKRIDEMVIATTENDTDDVVVDLANKVGIQVFRGSEHDVLARVWGAVKQTKAKHVVELTSDCPLIDPEIIDQVVELYFTSKCDYASTGTPVPNFPAGMDTQVFSKAALLEAHMKGKSPEDREHVSWYITHHPDRFKLVELKAPERISNTNIRLTLDTKGDCELIRRVIKRLYPHNPLFSCEDIVDLFDGDESLPRRGVK